MLEGGPPLCRETHQDNLYSNPKIRPQELQLKSIKRCTMYMSSPESYFNQVGKSHALSHVKLSLAWSQMLTDTFPRLYAYDQGFDLTRADQVK